ncbi:ABC transporter substrate-binding protein [Kineococcus sp. SYSU DK003]|uniref:ABC transporter substrate-binding protein n=1 Tax=Kineococcus sp. SYSU DK003 TaxID=3383124 RepID=UPI003D7DE869
MTRTSTTTHHARPTSRRTFLAAAGATTALAACGGPTSAEGRTSIRFFQNKPEVIEYFAGLVEEFNASQDEVFVEHDSSQTSLVAQFVRGDPPDVAAYNYNLETSNYVKTGVLSDLGDMPEAARVDPKYQALVDQFATYEDETSVLPYSVTSAGVIYNVALFEQAGLAVPTTWSQLLTACETFQAAGVVPVELTAREVWTLAQGLFDYTTGSALDVAAFFAALKEGQDVSFTEDMGEAGEKMVQLASFANDDAASRTYADGNLAFGRGEAAMYLQGPWALGEIAKVDPQLQVATFPLPATENPDEARARVNLDLSLWIPRSSAQPEAARTFISWLMSPEVIDRYNGDNLATSPLLDAPALQDPRVAGLQPSLDAGRIYQGANTYVPPTIPIGNYIQDAVLSGDSDTLLRRLDEDWGRLAARGAV